ncbi:uncharacterized protein [Pocillopora verrucosa]|uniref:uncharacterized protein isoform X3 n=1 Tax=Pocillopora verrucosa TaxID=203993 RepID=UPI00333FFA48
MTSPFVEPLPKRKRKKGPDDEITKNVVVLKSSQVCEMGGVVLMPKTTLDMSGIKKLGQSKKITFTKNTSSGDLQRKLEEKFPFLEEASGRFYCAKAVENRSKLDFCGDRCVWSGAFINKNITGNSALYIYCEEEKEGDSGHCSSDPDLPGAPVYGNCLVTAAPQGRKRFGSESCPTAEGPIDKETLRAVESQTCGTVRESDRNYRPFGEPEGVKTQVIEKEASACALTVGREAAEEEQIQDQNPNTWLLTPQPPLLLSDIREQTNRFTLAPLLESLPVCSKDIEIQEPYDQASTETLTAKGSQRAQQNTSVTVGDSDNQESSSEDRSDSGFETCTTPQDTSRNRDSLLSNTNTTGSPEPDEYETNNDFEDSILNQAAWFQINEDFKEVYSCYPGAKELKWPINPHELPLIDHNLRSEENGQDTLSRNSQNNAEVEETNQDVAQEISHPQVEGDEPNHIVEQEQFVRTICPSSSRLEGGGNFQISLKEELPEHIQSGYASFGNELVVLTKFNKLTLAGTIPAAQEPGVVKVRVFSDTDEFLGETDFQYEDMLNTVVFQAVQLGPDGLSKLFALMEKHMWNQRSSATQSSSAKQNSGQATGALNDSCQDRSSPVENTVMDDEYEDLVQHFQDFVKWLSEQSFHPIHSNTDTWLKLSNAVEGLCRKLACSEDEENFKGNQQTCSQEREENYFADAENSSCMSSEDDSASLSDPDNWSETFNACTEAEEDLEGDQLTCTQKRDENYFPNTEDYSSVSSETDSALSDSESWDESISDSSLSFSWVNSRSNKSLEAIPETESTQNSYKAVYSKLDVSHEILAPMTEGFTTEDSIGDNTFVGCGVCHKWNTSLPESKESEENCGKDDHNEKQDSSQEWVFYSEEGTSHTLLASHDDTPLHCLDVPTLNVENEESQYQDDELFETLHTNAEPQLSESICSVTSNQQSVTHPEPITQEAAQSPLSNPLWNGDSKLNMAPQQCSEEEIHSGQEWEESGEDLASWFNLCENEDTGKNEHSRWEISMEPSKTDGGVEKDIFDSEEDLSQEQGLISEQGDFHTRLSLPDDTSVQSRGPRVENEESQSIGDISIVEAARNGYTDTVRLLVEKGADVNQSGSMISKVTKLILAARKGQTDIVWLVLKEAIDQNKTVNWFCEHSPLTAAARNGHPDIVRLLIENRADVNKGEWSIGDISIVGAARNDYTDTVHLLVKKGADVNQSGSMGLPLTEAVKNGHTNIVRLLIENGADVNKGGLDTPLTEAAMNGHVFIVRLLIENGADVNKGGLDTPLTAAVRNGHTDIVRLLIQNGADVNQGGLDTPLTEAVANGHTDIVRLLIKNGANVNQGGLNLKHNPLTAAISYGHTDIVRLLIENGADVDQEGGDTSLDVAVKNGHTDIVRLLIENGADVNKGGGILLTEAVRKGHTDIVRLFIENGADVNQGGGNLLTEAVRKGHTDIVRLFIENGADVTQGGGVCIIIIGSVGIGRSILARSFIKNRTDVKQGGVKIRMLYIYMCLLFALSPRQVIVQLLFR